MNLTELADKKMAMVGEYVSIVFDGREITNVEIDSTAKKLGHALKKLGVKKGDRVILQMPNCPEVLEGFQAIWRIGAVVVPVNHLIGEEETAYIYEDSGTEVIITSLSYLSRIKACRERVKSIKHVILIEEDVPDGYLSYWQLVNESSADLEKEKTFDDDLAALIYTSGTTAKPKGVMHTHLSLYSNAKMQLDSIELPTGIRSLVVLPLCHSFGIATVNGGYLRDVGKTVLMNSFDIDAIYAAIEKHKINLMAAVPTMYVFMLLHPNPKQYDLSSMMYWISGAAALTMDTWKGFKDTYGFEIAQGWGLTEAGANNAVNPLNGRKKPGSIGLPMKGVEMKVCDDRGQELAIGQEGEILIKGPMLMKGYWNKPQETAEVIKNGWLYTGDIGYQDEDGYFFITERKKDLIIKAGENIAPREIEELLFSHPQVQEAAVVGIKDPIYGEDIKAFVVLKPGEQANKEELIEYCLKYLARFKVPKEWAFVASLPKNLMGKVLKKELRK